MLILYFFFVHLLLLVPALGVLCKLNFFQKTPLLQICMAYFSSISFLGTCGFFLYALSVPEGIVRLSILAVALIGTALFFREKAWLVLMPNRFILTLFLVMSLIPTIVISLSSVQSSWHYIPDPEFKTTSNYSVPSVKVLNFAHTPANDNYIPYRQAQFFVNRSDPAKDSFIDEWGVSFFQRTVLMGSVVSSFYTMFNDNPPIPYLWSVGSTDPSNTYQKFQIIAHILNSVLILPAFLLLARLFTKKTALLTSIFLASSQFYLYNAVFSWPKSLTAFFVLLSLFLLLERKRGSVALAGLVAGIAYLTHDLAIVFIITSAVFLILKSRWKDLAIYSATSLPMPALWMFVSSVIYNKHSTFIYYPFSLDGLPGSGSKRLLIHNFFHTSPLKILKIKFDGLTYLATPYQLLVSENGKELSTRLWALGIYSVPGSLGVGLLALGLFSLVSGFRKIKWEVWFFILFPVLIILLLFGNPRVLGSLHFSEPIVPLLAGCIVYITLELKQFSRRLLLSTLFINIAYTGFFILYSFDFNVSPWNNLKDIVSLLLLFIIFGFLALSAYIVLSKNTGFEKILGAGEQLSIKG